MLKITSYGDVTRFDLSRTLLGRGRYWTTCYLVDGMLVDTGCAFTASELVAALAGVPLQRITNTHSHEDHFGANRLLQAAQPGLEIRAHPLALPVLANPHTVHLQPYRLVFWGYPQPSTAQPLIEGDTVRTGKYCFQVLHTPGHSPDHLCLYEPERGWLFSGDLFVGGKDRALRAGYDIWSIIASLQRVATLPLTTLFPGSARVRQNPAADLAWKIAYLESIGEQVEALHRLGRSPKEIASQLFGGPMWIELVTLGQFTRRRLVLSYLRQNQE